MTAEAPTTKAPTETVTYAYIGRMPCGCVRGMCIDDPAKPRNTAKWVADMITNGMAVERMPLEQARQHPLGRCAQCDPPIVKASAALALNFQREHPDRAIALHEGRWLLAYPGEAPPESVVFPPRCGKTVGGGVICGLRHGHAGWCQPWANGEYEPWRQGDDADA